MTTEIAESLTETFNDAAAYRAAFPEQLANLVISSASDIVYVSPEVAALFTENVAEVKTMIAGRLQLMRDGEAAAMAGRFRLKRVNLDYLSFRQDVLYKRKVSDKYPAKMDLIFTFDHEIGHLIKGMSPNEHFDECVADAFATLRHLQRFGDKTDIFEYAPYMYAKEAIFDFPIHYTSAIMQKIDSLRKEGSIDIQSLSLEDTVSLARDIALKYALDDVTLNKIYDAYQPVREADKMGDLKQITKATVRVMLENKDNADIYRAGKLFLGSADMKDFIASDLGSDADSLLARMEEHEKQSGFILNAADAKGAARDGEGKKLIPRVRCLLRLTRQ